MQPAPQLQPVNPPPRLDYAEPAARPLELKPGPRPLDLRPRPPARQPLDVKYGPRIPAGEALKRAYSPARLGETVGGIVNNPLGYTPGRGIIQPIAALPGRVRDLHDDLSTPEEIDPGELPSLPSPSEFPDSFPRDAIGEGPLITPGVPPPFFGGQSPGVRYRLNYQYNLISTVGLTIEPPSVFTTGNPGYPGPISSFKGVGLPQWQRIVITYGSSNLTEEVRGGFSPQGNYRNIKVNNIFRADGQPDTGGNPPGAVAPQRAPNQARQKPSPFPLIPRPERGPFPQVPIPYTAPDFAPDFPPEFEPYKQPVPVLPPETVPLTPGDPDDRPFPPAEPFKTPAPITVPPGREDPTTPATPGQPRKRPLSPTLPTITPTRPVRPPFIPVPPGDPSTTTKLVPPFKFPPIITIPPIRTDDCLTGNEFRSESQRLRDLIEDAVRRLLEDCKDLCTPATITRTECLPIDGTLTQVSVFQQATTLSTALELISGEIAKITGTTDLCAVGGVEQGEPGVLGSGTMTEAQTVQYVPIGIEVRQVELLITGPLPAGLRLFDTTASGEQQGKFGSIVQAYPGVTGGFASEGFHQWAWTRRTSLFLGQPIRPIRRVRVYLRAGLSWTLYDTGLRS